MNEQRNKKIFYQFKFIKSLNGDLRFTIVLNEDEKNTIGFVTI